MRFIGSGDAQGPFLHRFSDRAPSHVPRLICPGKGGPGPPAGRRSSEELREHTRMAWPAALALGIQTAVCLYLWVRLADVEKRREENAGLCRAYAHELRRREEDAKDARALRHDLRNHLGVLRELAERRESGLLADYLRELSGAAGPPGQYARSGCPALDSILNDKLAQAAECGARVQLSLAVPAFLPVNLFDLSTILSNLLDNAIEGAAECEDKRLSVGIRLERGMLSIQIRNTYRGPLKRSSLEGYRTRKADRQAHGLGLKNVERALRRCHGQMSIDDRDGVFSVSVLLYLGDGPHNGKEEGAHDVL